MPSGQLVTLLDAQTFDATGVTDAGLFTLWESDPIGNPSDLDSLRVEAVYANAAPEPGVPNPTNYDLAVVVKSGDATLINQEPTFRGKHDMGSAFTLMISPAFFVAEGVAVWNHAIGSTITGHECKPQRHIPDEFTIALCVHEGLYGAPGAFQSVTATLQYELYNSE